MDKEFLSDLLYRIGNVEAEIENIKVYQEDNTSEEPNHFLNGYYDGRRIAMESELRFLEQMVKRYA